MNHHICATTVSLLAITCFVRNHLLLVFLVAIILMAAAINTSCEIWHVIRFLNTKDLKAPEIHYELCQVYRPIVMCKGMERQWYHEFIDGQTNIHEKERNESFKQ